jgi:signal transduction histidine kinase
MSNNVGSLVILGMAGMLILMMSVLLAVWLSQRKKNQHRKAIQILREQQQNQLIEAAVRSEETERHRIAEILHDEVGAILSSAKLQFLGIKAESLDEKGKKSYEKARELLNDVIQSLRTISHNMHSSVLKDFGLNEAIRHFARKVTEGTGLSATTSLDEAYNEQNPETDINTYRVMQELINNTLKYAGATKIKIGSHLAERILIVTLQHNGNGLSQPEFEALRFQKEGLGLKNIQNRMTLLKGKILFAKNSRESTVTIRVPLPAKPFPDEKN